jgi:hypothetical protein
MNITVIIAFSIMAFGVLYYRKRWLKAKSHHASAAKLWQKMMLNIMSEQIASKFANTAVANHVVRAKEDGKIEILIGNDDALVPVDMELFKSDVDLAFEEAYSRFVFNTKV